MAAEDEARTQLRVGLLHAGYEVLPADGKRVLLEDWSNRQLSDAEVQSWAHFPAWTNTGARTRRMPTLDIDINHTAGAEAIEQLVRARYIEHGQVLVRIGNAPRRAIPFRTEHPFDKLSVKLQAPDGTQHKLEFLGKGQQVIVHGIHPDTKKPYRWLNGNPDSVRLAELPAITLQEATELLHDCAECLVQEHGFQHVATQASATNSEFTTPPPPEDVDPTEIDIVMDMLRYVSPDITYEDWFHVGCSLYNMLGTRAGLFVWDAWSKGGRKYKRGEINTKWSGIKANEGYGYKHRFFQLLTTRAHLDSLTGQEINDLNESITSLVGKIEFPPNVQISIAAAPAERDWPTLSEAARYGFAGHVLSLLEPHTEADSAAVLLQLLALFGMLVGRNFYYRVGHTYHHANISSVIVGATGSRKGMGLDHIKAMVRIAMQDNPPWVSEHIRSGGIGSGEGILEAIRDPILKHDKKTGEEICVDEGVEDKRLAIVEPEFAALLSAKGREGSTISPVIRKLWDGDDLEIMRRSALHVTNPHVVIIGHITPEEMRMLVTRTDMANGFMNRFLLCVARRSKSLPHGGNLPDTDMQRLGADLRGILDYLERQPNTRITMTQSARLLWEIEYPKLGQHPPGLLGAITGRAEAQVVRCALIYALLDCAKQIDSIHLNAALAVWQYCAASAKHIFGDTVGNVVADEILAALRSSGGMTRHEISRMFPTDKAKHEVPAALAVLLQMKLVGCKQKQTGGRVAEFWFPL